MADSIREWLTNLGLEKYAEGFEAEEIDVDVLSSLTEDDLRDLGVTALGHRKKILKAAASNDQTEDAPTPTAPEPAPAVGPPVTPLGVEDLKRILKENPTARVDAMPGGEAHWVTKMSEDELMLVVERGTDALKLSMCDCRSESETKFEGRIEGVWSVPTDPLPPAVLELLARDPGKVVYKRNPVNGQPTEYRHVRVFAAMNPNMPTETLRQLVRGFSLLEMRFVLQNPNMPEDVLRRLGEEVDMSSGRINEGGDRPYALYVALNPNTPNDLLQALTAFNVGFMADTVRDGARKNLAAKVRVKQRAHRAASKSTPGSESSPTKSEARKVGCLEVSPETFNRITELMDPRTVKKIQAIKVLREETGCGLAEAKLAIEQTFEGFPVATESPAKQAQQKTASDSGNSPPAEESGVEPEPASRPAAAQPASRPAAGKTSSGDGSSDGVKLPGFNLPGGLGGAMNPLGMMSGKGPDDNLKEAQAAAQEALENAQEAATEALANAANAASKFFGRFGGKK